MKLDEFIEKIENSLKNINDRMDSFVDQITQTKQSVYDLCQQNLQKLENQVNRNREFLSGYEKLKDITGILSKKLKDDFKEEVKKNNDNLQAVTLDLIKRFNSLEDYIKNDRFHSLLIDINKLEDKFHKEAFKIS